MAKRKPWTGIEEIDALLSEASIQRPSTTTYVAGAARIREVARRASSPPVAWRVRSAEDEGFPWVYLDRWETVQGFMRQGWHVEALLAGGPVGVGAVLAEGVSTHGPR